MEKKTKNLIFFSPFQRRTVYTGKASERVELQEIKLTSQQSASEATHSISLTGTSRCKCNYQKKLTKTLTVFIS